MPRPLQIIRDMNAQQLECVNAFRMLLLQSGVAKIVDKCILLVNMD